jgi:8-oxo-dGTP pyrophosphatase MutT (NUDIX family)
MDWAFAERCRAEIDAHFASLCETLRLWNGRVMLARNPALVGDCFSAHYFETDFASLVAWRDWGYPDPEVFNGFGMGAIRTSDGAFLLGEMADHTANAGKIYFPSGTPDPSDRVGSVVDLAGSVAREVLEETGLSPSDYVAERAWTIVRTQGQFGHIRVLQANDNAATLLRRIETWLSSEDRPEFSAIYAVRRTSELPDATTDIVRTFLTDWLPA